jgi:hypothetical protein
MSYVRYLALGFHKACRANQQDHTVVGRAVALICFISHTPFVNGQPNSPDIIDISLHTPRRSQSILTFFEIPHFRPETL